MADKQNDLLFEIIKQADVITREYANAITALQKGKIAEANNHITEANSAIAIRNYLIDKLKEL